tara:strand:- start:2478 stop:4115 length:1638 start_codon:yes stop_codon:yes gene_type:complete
MLSHKLLLKAGYISQLSAGIFSFTPMGWKVINNIKKIVNDEMKKINCLEANLPVIQPSNIWEQSGRIDSFIPPLANFKDRRDKKMIIAPTHEEAVIDLVKNYLRSFRDLPFSVYHIQTKFRDETRPRGGLLRVREFEMKDAYSFHEDEKSLDEIFEKFSEAYFNIFNRCGLNVVKVAADSGAIGGKVSSEFISLSESGEDTILICENCMYSANEEKAEFVRLEKKTLNQDHIEEVETVGIKSIDELSKFFNLGKENFLKTLVYIVDKRPVLVTVAGDLEVNETKLRNYLGGEPRLANDQELIDLELSQGYLSPVNKELETIIDLSVDLNSDYIAGANKDNFHVKGIIPKRDFNKIVDVLDLANAKVNDFSPYCDDSCPGFKEYKGIEVGHIFKLGSSYSSKMELNYLNSDGKIVDVEMGCYGIGIGRLLAAIIESNSTEKQLKFNNEIAPFEIYLASLNTDNVDVVEQSEKIYTDLLDSGFDVLFDDRNESPGVKFNDYDLSGVPVRIVISSRSLKNNEVEINNKINGNTQLINKENLIEFLKKI